MAIKAAVSYKQVQIPSAYVRLVELNGNRNTGWSGVFNLYGNEDAAREEGLDQHITRFSAGVSYRDENDLIREPFSALYAAVKPLLAAQLGATNILDV